MGSAASAPRAGRARRRMAWSSGLTGADKHAARASADASGAASCVSADEGGVKTRPRPRLDWCRQQRSLDVGNMLEGSAPHTRAGSGSTVRASGCSARPVDIRRSGGRRAGTSPTPPSAPIQGSAMGRVPRRGRSASRPPTGPRAAPFRPEPPMGGRIPHRLPTPFPAIARFRPANPLHMQSQTIRRGSPVPRPTPVSGATPAPLPRRRRATVEGRAWR